jgi:hypothetical protein
MTKAENGHVKIWPWYCAKKVTTIPHLTVIANYRYALKRTPLRLRLWFYIVQGSANARRKKSFSIANCGINFFFGCHL